MSLLALAFQSVLCDADDLVVRGRGTPVTVAAEWIADTSGDGVIQVFEDRTVVDLQGAVLRGSPPGTPPDRYQGVGIHVKGARNVFVRNATLTGFKVGIWAEGADYITIEDCRIDDGFRQRLLSTPEAEDVADWLRPHDNDDGEWVRRYGAGVYLEDTFDPTVRRVTARRVQNGIVLDGVDEADIHDNDCSFLSGWGLALWRSNDNDVFDNAFDFCVRGYSHGVYNRGQDSAGILLFEQCSRNRIVGNSATHGGDGFFAFAGREALGQRPAADPEFDHAGRGNNGNRIHGNDFSWAAAHGLELTFSFDNEVTSNQFTGNAICGIWGGYSSRTRIEDNRFEANGDAGYGLERGGVNIEHGDDNRIAHNRFRDNACGIHLWVDSDPELAKTPWVVANAPSGAGNTIVANEFAGDVVAIQLRDVTAALWGNTMESVGTEVVGTWTAGEPEGPRLDAGPSRWFLGLANPGGARPVGARAHLAGREHIVMTEWGPYDWERPLLRRVPSAPGTHGYELLGGALDEVAVTGDVSHTVEGATLAVRPREGDALVPYSVEVRSGDDTLSAAGALLSTSWDLAFFASAHDPIASPDAWRAAGEARHVSERVGALDLAFGSRGPSELGAASATLREAALPSDHFGVLGSANVRCPAGRFVLRTVSDDGLRVYANDALVIDDWTHHAPRVNEHTFELDEPAEFELRVEYFELSGYAQLRLDLIPE